MAARVASACSKSKHIVSEAIPVPTEWSSCSRKRIVRSSASAEPALTAGGFEHGEFAQAILCEIRDLWFSVCNWERHVSSCPIILVFDARLAYSCLENETLPQDRRPALDL